MPDSSPENTGHKRQRSYLLLLVICIGLLYLLVYQEMRFFRVPSSSMAPTLKPQDFIVTFSSQQYHRGDIVVLNDPEEENGYIVKRIVAIGGDRVEVDRGALVLNGSYVSEPYLMETINYKMTGNDAVDVPEGAVFVLGDNRNQSLDSSLWQELPGWTSPWLTEDKIVGKVAGRYLPLARAGKINSYPLGQIADI